MFGVHVILSTPCMYKGICTSSLKFITFISKKKYLYFWSSIIVLYVYVYIYVRIFMYTYELSVWIIVVDYLKCRECFTRLLSSHPAPPKPLLSLLWLWCKCSNVNCAFYILRFIEFRHPFSWKICEGWKIRTEIYRNIIV